MGFQEVTGPAPLALVPQTVGVTWGLQCGRCTKGELWADVKTKGNTMKAVRALKLHVLKKTAVTASEFLGAGSKTLTMVLALKKLPSNMKALPMSLPHALGHPVEGLFLRTATGKKVLSVQFGRGDMEVEALAKNASAVTRSVVRAKGFDTSLVRDVTVEVDRLSLPIWNHALWDKGKHGRSAKSSSLNTKRKGSMAPPLCLPVKKAKLF